MSILSLTGQAPSSCAHRAAAYSTLACMTGDLLIVDRSLKPKHSNIIIAGIDGEFKVKRLLITPDGPVLQPMNPAYPVIKPDPDSLQIFGVVIHFIHSTRRRN